MVVLLKGHLILYIYPVASHSVEDHLTSFKELGTIIMIYQLLSLIRITLQINHNTCLILIFNLK